MTATVVLDLIQELDAKSNFAKLHSKVLILPSASNLLGTSA